MNKFGYGPFCLEHPNSCNAWGKDYRFASWAVDRHNEQYHDKRVVAIVMDYGNHERVSK